MKILDQVSSLIANKMNEKNRYYVLAAILIGIFVIDYLFIMMPQVRTLLALNPKISALSKDLKQARDDIKKVDQYQAELRGFKEKMKTIGKKILNREEIPTILDNISLIANASKVRINQIMPIRESQNLVLTTDEGKYFSFPILVVAKGGYHDLGRFLNKIENNRIFMSIMDFDITGNSDDTTHHSARITIKAFIREKSEGKGE